ncbi:MAG: hypothetical protein HW380_1856 [Magnetococcales bacterium]|nr:hypothetical protein [Magnetococcales bacterium]HIJ85294.1 hypothetical protein [Magnetococcales bacterium]
MKFDRWILTLLVGSGLLGGCSSSVTLPWEKDLLDPGRVATREPLEIPPDLSELPGPEAKQQDASLDAWVNPYPSAEGGRGASGNQKLPFEIPTVSEEKGGLSRNENDKLPAWMESPVKVR